MYILSFVPHFMEDYVEGGARALQQIKTVQTAVLQHNLLFNADLLYTLIDKSGYSIHTELNHLYLSLHLPLCE